MAPEIYDMSGARRDMAWLRQKYGNVQFLDAGAGPKFRLVRVDETEGPAVIKVRLLDQQGQPRDLEVLAAEPPGRFDQAALEAVQAYRFVPFEQDGEVYERRAGVRIRFALE